MSRAAPHLGAHDSAVGAGLRFALELLAWAAIGWAWGWPPLAASVAALAVFGVRGDKRNVIVAVRGPLRLALELGIIMLGLFAAYQAWGALVAGVGAMLMVAYLVAARARLRWLLLA